MGGGDLVLQAAAVLPGRKVASTQTTSAPASATAPTEATDGVMYTPSEPSLVRPNTGTSTAPAIARMSSSPP